MSTHARSRLAVTRRALVGAAWVLAWMVVWGCALLLFARRAQAAPRAPAAASLLAPQHGQGAARLPDERLTAPGA
jgi:hypothetical protein